MSKGLKVAVAIMALFLAFSITLCSIFIKERNEDNIPAGKNESFFADDKPGGILDETSSLWNDSSKENSSEESSSEEESSREESSSKNESSSQSSSSKNESSSRPSSSSQSSSSKNESSSRPQSSSQSSSSKNESSSRPSSSSQSSSSKNESSSRPSSSSPPVSSSNPSSTVNDYRYILGTSEKTATELANYVLRYERNPKLTCTIYELAQYYIEEGAKEGVRGDVAFCQAIKETGWFRYGGDVKYDQNNFCGLGAVGGGAGGASFENARIGVRAHIQHLKGYATTAPLNQPCVDPRYSGLASAGRLGCAQKWTGLNGTWAIPGVGYGERILAIYENI